MRSPNKQFTMLSRPNIEVSILIIHENIIIGGRMGSSGDSKTPSMIWPKSQKVRKSPSEESAMQGKMELTKILNKGRSNPSPNISGRGTDSQVAMEGMHLIRPEMP